MTGARLRAEGQGRQGWSLEDKLGLGCARLGWAGLDWTRGAAVLAGEFVDRSVGGKQSKKYDSFFSDLFGLGGKRCAGRFAHKRGRKSRRVQVNAAAAWRDEDCRGSLERRDEGYVGKISNNNKDEGRRRGEWRGTRSRADFRESLGTDLEGEIEHDADDAVRWGGRGKGGRWQRRAMA